MRRLETLTIPCGLGTLNLSRSPLEIRNEDLIAMDGITSELDTWQKLGGAAKFNGTAIAGAPTVLRLHDYVGDDDDATQELVAALSDGKLVTVDSGGIVKTLKNGLTATEPFVMAEGSHNGDKLLAICNGKEMMQIYKGGDATADVQHPPADWATDPPGWCFQHNGRMWAGGKPHQIYGSKPDEMEQFDDDDEDTHLFPVYPGEGQYLVGGVSWRGRAFFFKYPQGIYYLDDRDTNADNWEVKRFAKYVGAAGHNAIVEALDDVFFLSPDGYIHALSAVDEFGDAESSAILPNALGPFLRDNVNFTRLAHAQGAFYATKRKLFWGVTRGMGSTNNLMVGLDLHRSKRHPQGFSSSRDECTAVAIRRHPTTRLEVPLLGDSQGFVWEIERATRNKDGQEYDARFETKDIEFYRHGLQRANLRELEVEFSSVLQNRLTIDVFLDGQFSQSLGFESLATGGALGSFLFGTSVLGIDGLQNARQRLYGDARRIRLIGQNSQVDENFNISTITVKYQPGTDKLA